MNSFQNTDNLLRRFLKRKVKITDAVVVAFLITGGIGFATVAPSQGGQAEYVLEQIEQVKAPDKLKIYAGIKSSF